MVRELTQIQQKGNILNRSLCANYR